MLVDACVCVHEHTSIQISTFALARVHAQTKPNQSRHVHRTSIALSPHKLLSKSRYINNVNAMKMPLFVRMIIAARHNKTNAQICCRANQPSINRGVSGFSEPTRNDDTVHVYVSVSVSSPSSPSSYQWRKFALVTFVIRDRIISSARTGMSRIYRR